MDWSRTMTLLSHEVRSPATVILGYARMIREGRLDDATRAQAMLQIEQAAARIAAIGRQASGLAKWLSRDGHASSPATVPLRALLADVLPQAGTPSLVSVEVEPAAESTGLSVSDRGAVVAAIAGVIDLVCADVPHTPVRVLGRRHAGDAWFELIIGPTARLAALAAPNPQPAKPFAADRRGGLGLSLILASTVIEAHGGTIWTAGSPPELWGITMPAVVEPS
jgi:signal transduction histidine kinase